MHLRLAVRHRRPPVRFNRRTRRWSLRCTQRFNWVDDDDPSTPHPLSASQFDLFPGISLEPNELTLRTKYGSRRKRKRHKGKKGLQYKIQFYRGIQGKMRERKFVNQTRDADETNDLVWDEATINTITALLVDVTFEDVFKLEIKGSTRIAEIVAWVNRRYDEDSPFNFEACCAMAGYDPDRLRDMFFSRLKRVHGTDFPHYRVLRDRIIDAEHGDSDAIEWVLSENDGPLSFRDCCYALGFNHRQARNALLLPIVIHDDDALYQDLTSPLDEPMRSAAPLHACA